jgi:hypothetical protein
MLLGVFGVERKLYIIHDGLRLATPKIYFHLANMQTNWPAIEVVLDRVCLHFCLTAWHSSPPRSNPTQFRAKNSIYKGPLLSSLPSHPWDVKRTIRKDRKKQIVTTPKEYVCTVGDF